MMYRQGDLMIRRTANTDTAKQPTEQTLAIGEESGHSHVIDAVMIQPGLIDVPVPTMLRVAGMPWRHDALELPAGRYEYWIQRELTEDEELEQIRQVED